VVLLTLLSWRQVAGVRDLDLEPGPWLEYPSSGSGVSSMLGVTYRKLGSEMFLSDSRARLLLLIISISVLRFSSDSVRMSRDFPPSPPNTLAGTFSLRGSGEDPSVMVSRVR